MRIVSRYLLAEFLKTSTGVLLALLVTFVAADSLLNLDDLADDWRLGLRRVGLRGLDVLPLGIPLACVAGAVWSLTRAVRMREITAIRAGGIPLRSALLPLLVASLVISGGLILFEDRVLVPGRQALSNEAGNLEGRSEGPRHLADRWWFASGQSVFSAEHYDPDDRTLEHVSVFVLDDTRRVVRRIDAAEARHVDGHAWEFHAAQIFEMGANGATPRSVEALRIDLGLSGQDMERARPSPDRITVHRLAERAREGDPAERPLYATALHSRLAAPFAVLALVLLAIPFAIGDVERGDSLPRALLMAIGCAAAFWLVFTLAVLAGRSGLVPAFLPLWGAIVATLGLGIWRFNQIAE